MSTTSKKWLEGLHRIIFPRALVFFPVPYHMVLSDGDRVKSHAVRYLALSEQFWIELLVLPHLHVSVIFPFLIFPFFFFPKQAGEESLGNQPPPVRFGKLYFLVHVPAHLHDCLCPSVSYCSPSCPVLFGPSLFFFCPPPHPPLHGPLF